MAEPTNKRSALEEWVAARREVQKRQLTARIKARRSALEFRQKRIRERLQNLDHVRQIVDSIGKESSAAAADDDEDDSTDTSDVTPARRRR
jgi:hypothetical protein